jgi:hypothetical protein
MKLGLKEMETVLFFWVATWRFKNSKKKGKKKRETCDFKVFFSAIFGNKNN